MDIPTVQSLISDVAGKYLVSAGNTNQGINGFLFDVQVQDELAIENEVTDHYVESNIAVHDHVAKRPKTITLRGLIGELKHSVNVPFGVVEAAQNLLDIGGIAPNFASQATQAYAKAAGVVSRIDSYINSINTISDVFDNASSASTEQQKAMDKLTAFAGQSSDNQADPVLCTVQTPFGPLSNMIITKVIAVQREDTTLISDIIVALKQIRKVDFINSSSKILSGRAADAFSSVSQKGQVIGKTISVSLFNSNWDLLE